MQLAVVASVVSQPHLYSFVRLLDVVIYILELLPGKPLPVWNTAFILELLFEQLVMHFFLATQLEKIGG